MSNLAVTKGHRVFLADTLADLLSSTQRIWLEEVSETPDKTSEPEKIDAPAIHLRRQRQISGVPGAPDSISYTLNADFTETTGNYDTVLGLLGETMWIFEEYVDSGSTDSLGAGYLYYGKIESVGMPGQSLNNLLTFPLNVTNLGDDDYFVRFTGTDTQIATYKSVFTGNTVTPVDPV